MTAFTPATVQVILERDLDSCIRCGRQVDRNARGLTWSVHHRRPRGMGGSRDPLTSSPVNGVVLCGSGTTGCHGWVEAHRQDALDAGLLVSRWQDPELVPVRHWLHGLAFLTTEGWTPIPVGGVGALVVAEHAAAVGRARGLSSEDLVHVSEVLVDLTASWVRGAA